MASDRVKGLESTVVWSGWAQKRGAGFVATWANRLGFILAQKIATVDAITQ